MEVPNHVLYVYEWQKIISGINIFREPIRESFCSLLIYVCTWPLLELETSRDNSWFIGFYFCHYGMGQCWWMYRGKNTQPRHLPPLPHDCIRPWCVQQAIVAWAMFKTMNFADPLNTEGPCYYVMTNYMFTPSGHITYNLFHGYYMYIHITLRTLCNTWQYIEMAWFLCNQITYFLEMTFLLVWTDVLYRNDIMEQQLLHNWTQIETVYALILYNIITQDGIKPTFIQPVPFRTSLFHLDIMRWEHFWRPNE